MAAGARKELPEGKAGDIEVGRRAWTLDELRQKRAKVKEALDYMKALPSEAEVVQLAVAGLTGNDTDDGRREAALDILLDMAGLIDVANDLEALGAILPIMEQLSHPSPQFRAMAANIIGTAAANNPVFSQHATSHGAVPALLARLRGDETEVRVKALFALSQLVRAPGPALEAFTGGGGLSTLYALVSTTHEVHKLRLRAVVLLSDIAMSNPRVDVLPAAEELSHVAAAISDMASKASEWDVLEKLLRACSQLLGAGNEGRTIARALVKVGFDAAVEAAFHRLLAEAAPPDGSYTTELAALREEVRGLLAGHEAVRDEL